MDQRAERLGWYTAYFDLGFLHSNLNSLGEYLMAKFKVGDKVEITQINKPFGYPYVGKRGLIRKVNNSEDEELINYHIELQENNKIIATIIVFEMYLKIAA